ncbi:MAG: Hsp20/alpha crystallin family protein [Isosphaeraceae bacterium]|nr:Hsp20/alpha crystallin family protein [Isosphaeraceae bacterium]
MARLIPLRRDWNTTLNGLQHELNRLFEEYVNPHLPPGAAPTDIEPTAWSPAIDLLETPEEIILLADLPGVDPSRIELSVTGTVLDLRGEKPATDVPGGRPSVQERLTGTFHRQVTLSAEVNFDAAQAEAHNGVLKVRLPKQEAAKPRTIPIQPK